MKKFLVLALVLIISTSAFSFTIVTEVTSTEKRAGVDAKLVDTNRLEIDLTNSPIAEEYPWHKGKYLFFPYYYSPVVEGKSSEDKPTVSFRVRFNDEDTRLKCSTRPFSFASHAKIGDTVICHMFDPWSSSSPTLEYRIVDIRGPTYTSPVFYTNSDQRNRVREGDSKTVVIELEIRFSKVSPETRVSIPDFQANVDDRYATEWFSSYAELDISRPTTPVNGKPDLGPSEKIEEPYYIYFSEEDRQFIAQNYLPLVKDNFFDLIREENFSQALKLFYERILSEPVFSLKRCDSGVMVRCSYDFSEQSLIPHRMNCRGMYTNSYYKATLFLPMQSGPRKAVEFLWYTDSQGRLLNLEVDSGDSFDC